MNNRRAGTIFLLFAAMIFSMVGTATADSSMTEGTATAQEAEDERVAELLEEDPSLAGSIGSNVDFEEESSEDLLDFVEASEAGVTSSEFLAAVSCKRITSRRVVKTLLGFTAYRYNATLVFCYDGRLVTSVRERNAYIDLVDPNFYWRGIVTDTLGPVNITSSESFLQGKVENCIIKYGCIGVDQPWARQRFHGNGTWSGTTGG